MNDPSPPAQPDPDSVANRATSSVPDARVRRRGRGRISLIWLVPIAAALIAGFLGVRAIYERGERVVIVFNTADGLVAGQTPVKHKSVELGRVDSIRLSNDLRHVDVTLQMQREARRYLTSNARFWIVRPRLSTGSISGLDTLISGAYIEMDPGAEPSSEAQSVFTGLEDPPGVRSDEPGRTFVLASKGIGSLGPGSPVFFHEIVVGEVLSYDIGTGEGPVKINVFVRQPFDSLVRKGTHFWNTSGLNIELGAQGIRFEVASLQAMLAGGVSFDTPHEARASPVAETGASFPLFRSADDANAAGFRTRVPYVIYLQTSVRGLANGAPVEMYGIQVGTVTDVRLQLDPFAGTARIRVLAEVQPERIFGPGMAPAGDAIEITRTLVRHGMRASLRSANYLTGQQVVSLDFVPSAPPADLIVEGDATVIPTQSGGGLDAITTALSDIAAKLNRLPLDEIGQNLNATLASLNATVGGPEIKQAIRDLSGTLASLQDLVRKTDTGIAPLLRRLPEISVGLQDLLTRTGRVLASVDSGYGANSEVNRSLQRLLSQVNDAARSIRVLVDYLDRHPEALVRGRAGQAAER